MYLYRRYSKFYLHIKSILYFIIYHHAESTWRRAIGWELERFYFLWWHYICFMSVYCFLKAFCFWYQCFYVWYWMSISMLYNVIRLKLWLLLTLVQFFSVSFGTFNYKITIQILSLSLRTSSIVLVLCVKWGCKIVKHYSFRVQAIQQILSFRRLT